MTGKRKAQIAREWKRVTFTSMKGIDERSTKELANVLRFEKSLRRKKK